MSGILLTTSCCDWTNYVHKRHENNLTHVFSYSLERRRRRTEKCRMCLVVTYAGRKEGAGLGGLFERVERAAQLV